MIALRKGASVLRASLVDAARTGQEFRVAMWAERRANANAFFDGLIAPMQN